VAVHGLASTASERQQPVGNRGCSEPASRTHHAELDRAVADSDPLHGIAQLVACWAAAFVIVPEDATRTAALSADRMARRVSEALCDGDPR